MAAGDPPALALLERVMARQADLVASWMGVGFIHGVMNTDNMAISGETIDYGPCAFMDAYREGEVFSSIDVGGRYAYGNQPRIAHWNLAQLAQALLPLVPGPEEAAVEVAQAAVNRFPEMFQQAWAGVMRRKLGLSRADEGDADLAATLLSIMEADGADFTLTFRGLAECAGADSGIPSKVGDLFSEPASVAAWAERWAARIADDELSPAERRTAMRAENPLFIPRNHRVEEALAAAEEGDLGPFERLRRVLARPFDDQPDEADLARPPRAGEAVTQTFCGT